MVARSGVTATSRGRRDDGQLRGRRADDAEPLAGLRIGDDRRTSDDPAVGDRRLDDAVLVDPSAPAGLGREVEVRRQEGLLDAGLADEAEDEALEEVGPVVELVVPEDVDVVRDLRLGDRVGRERADARVLRRVARERGRGEERIAGVDVQDRVPERAGVGQLAQRDRLEGRDAADRERRVLADRVRQRQQRGLAIAVVEQRERDALLLGRGRRREREAGDDADRRGAAASEPRRMRIGSVLLSVWLARAMVRPRVRQVMRANGGIDALGPTDRRERWASREVAVKSRGKR